jgi:hypothetical protein
MEATTYHLKNNPHMHDQFEMIPREQRKLFLNSRRHLSTIAHEPKRESHFQHPEHILRDDTKTVLTNFQHYCQMSNMNVFKHGENKDAVDGLNYKLI